MRTVPQLAGSAQSKTVPRIVVGVDGSETSLEALRFALSEAERTGAEVQAVRVWEYPMNYGAAIAIPSNYHPAEEATTELSKCVKTVATERHDRGDVPQPVILSVVEGTASMVLCELAKDAQLLVVGSRGHGAIVGTLLGSVSHYCVGHASCPVVVIPDPSAAVHHHRHFEDEARSNVISKLIPTG